MTTGARSDLDSVPETVEQVLALVPQSPMRPLVAACDGRKRRVLLKEEGWRGGSVKDRTAIGLLRAMHRERALTPGTVIIESTSGNLGVALGRLAPRLGCRFIAVVDPNLPTGQQAALTELGVELVWIKSSDPARYLAERIATVKRLLSKHEHYRWPNQYSNPANWTIHRDTTAPELVGQAGSSLAVVYAAVSTGGTLAGISAYLKSLTRRIRLVAVDAVGSVVTGDCSGPRFVAGIGAGCRSSFIGPDSYDHAVRVSDAQAIAACRILREDVGLALGGSSGSVLFGWLQDDLPDHSSAVCLSADSGGAYLDSYYDDDWLAGRGLRAEVVRQIDRLRAGRISFEQE